MKTRITVLACCLAFLSAPLSVRAADEIGDPAPPLSISDWVQGEPVDLSAGKGKKFYVIEFWATWCGPCRTTIPHLTELQKQYADKGLVVVGVTDEPRAIVEPYVKQMGDKMQYTVAVDKRQATTMAYLGAFNVPGIPYAFVVDKTGAIAWHGHPGEGMDDVLERIAAGRFDVQLAKREAEATRLMGRYFDALMMADRASDPSERQTALAQASQIGGNILDIAARSPQVLNDFAVTILLMPDMPARDFDLAAKAAELAYKASDKKPADKARKLMQDYFGLVQSSKPDQPLPDKAREQLDQWGKQIVKEATPETLDSFAWVLMTAQALRHRDPELALQAAEAANRKAEGKDVSILETYAMALFEAGRREQAVKHLKKAIELAEDPGLAQHLQQTLRHYETQASNAQ